MGTNYYYHINPCQHCNRSDVLHVGKKSMGWTFGFRAYRGLEGHQDIVSLADWARVFKTVPGILVDENEVVVDDPMRFLTELERPSVGQQELEDSPQRRGPASPHPVAEHEWRDAEGFRFYDGEFC